MHKDIFVFMYKQYYIIIGIIIILQYNKGAAIPKKGRLQWGHLSVGKKEKKSEYIRLENNNRM